MSKQNAPARRRESPNFGATSDDFSTISGKFQKVSQNLILTWHLNFTKFHEISKKSRLWFHSTCHNKEVTNNKYSIEYRSKVNLVGGAGTAPVFRHVSATAKQQKV